MTAILNQIAEKWFSWQLSMFWQVGLLIIIVAGLDLLIKKWVWPQVRYALWLLILVKLVLPPTLMSPTSFTAEIPFIVKQTAIKISQPQTPHTIKPVIVPVTELIPADTTTQPVEIIPAPYTAHATPAGAFLSGKTYVFFVWLAGVGILSGWLIIRLSNLRHQHLDKQSNLPERLEYLLVSTARKLGLKKTPQVILTNKVCCPAVFGIFRPVLLIPADKLQNMTSQDAEHIFLHELAHIKRGDLLVHAVYMILQIAYWFNPLLWLIRKNLQNLRELCCDATVARLLKEKTIGYRQTLLETARQLLAEPVDPGLGLLGLFENSSWLVDRLGWLEKKSWKYRPLRIATVFILICSMSAFVLPMTKFEAPVDFVIKGTVTDAQTSEPIAGAKVGDTEKYADGKFYTTTDANGNYSYKTYYEEHGVKAEADGYKRQNKGFGTKLFGKEKEKVINFALKATKDTDLTEIKKTDKQNDFSIILSNGTTVELVGVCDYPSEGKQWWKPDGSKMDKPEFQAHSYPWPDDPNRLQLKCATLLKFHNYLGKDVSIPKVNCSNRFLFGNGFNSAIANDGTQITYIIYNPREPADLPDKTDISIGIPTVEFIQAERVGKYDATAVQMYYLRGNSSITYLHPLRIKHLTGQEKLAVDLSYTIDNIEFKLLYKLKNNEIKTANWFSSSGEGGSLKGAVKVKTFEIPAKQEEIEDIILEFRPYEWVEFKNVSLKPGFKTDVQIEVEKPAGQGKQEETKKTEFEQLLRKPVTLDISKSPNGNKTTVQDAVMAVCAAAGVPYAWQESAIKAEAERVRYIEPLHVKDIPARQVITDILKPFGLSYKMGSDGLFIYKNDANGTGEQAGQTEDSRSLLMKRKDVLEKALRTVEMKSKAGQADSAELLQAKVNLLKVESELAQTPQEQIKIIEQIAALYKEQEKRTELLLDAGRVTQDELNKVKLLRLDAENEFAKAKAEAKEQQDVDVYIEDFKISPYEAGGLYTVTAKIGNKGNATSPPFRMNFFKGDPKENLNLHGKPQSGSYGAGPIRPGDFWNEQSSPFALDEGSNMLFVVLDFDNEVAEANENNNQAILAIDVNDSKIIKKLSGQSVIITRSPDGHIRMTVSGAKLEEQTGMTDIQKLQINYDSATGQSEANMTTIPTQKPAGQDANRTGEQWSR